jgi:hypothetical protein
MGKSRLPCIVVRDRAGRLLLEKKLTGVPLKEEAVIAGTVAYYNDPNPCIIRRSAVMKLYFNELLDMLLPYAGRGPVAIDTLPARFPELVDLPADAVLLYMDWDPGDAS